MSGSNDFSSIRIGTRVRHTDGAEGKIAWANSTAVKIQWDDGEKVTWKRAELAGKGLQLIEDDAAEPRSTADTTALAPPDGDAATELPAESAIEPARAAALHGRAALRGGGKDDRPGGDNREEGGQAHQTRRARRAARRRLDDVDPNHRGARRVGGGGLRAGDRKRLVHVRGPPRSRGGVAGSRGLAIDRGFGQGGGRRTRDPDGCPRAGPGPAACRQGRRAARQASAWTPPPGCCPRSTSPWVARNSSGPWP